MLTATSFSPASLTVNGGTIAIIGSGLTNVQSSGNVQIKNAGGADYYVSKSAINDNLLNLSVGALPAGTYQIYLYDGTTSVQVPGNLVITPVPIPVINSISPNTGSSGSNITIYGSNFDPTTGMATVSIGGQNATIISITSTQINAVVPTGTPNTTVSVVVTSDSQTSNSNILYTYTSFTPSLDLINGINPNIGGVGQTVELRGNFGSGVTASEIEVDFVNTQSPYDTATGTGIVLTNTVGNTFDFIVPNLAYQSIYNVSVKVNGVASSNYLQFSNELAGQVNINPLTAPQISAGPSQSSASGTTTETLTGTLTAAGSAPANTITYLWTLVSGLGTIQNPNSLVTQVTGLGSGTNTFQLQALDGNGLSAFSQVTITVGNIVNPTNSAGPTQNLNFGVTTANLSGTAAPGGSSTIVSNVWSFVSGPNTPTINNPNSLTGATATGLITGSYVFALTTTDADSGFVVSHVNIIASVSAPNITPPTINGLINQTLTPGVFTDTLNPTATPGSNSTLNYDWTLISGQGTIISPNSLQTQITGLGLGSNVFNLLITAGDTGSASQNVTINTSISTAPPTVIVGPTQNITLPINSVNLTSSSTPSPGNTITGTSWTVQSGPSVPTFGTANASNTSVNNLIQGNYQFLCTVTQSNGSTATAVVNVTVTGTAPVTNPNISVVTPVNITLPAQATVSGNGTTQGSAPISSTIWSKISGPSGDTILSPSSLTTTINFVNAGQYVYQILVTQTDSGSSSKDVTVNVSPQAVVTPTTYLTASFQASVLPDGSGIVIKDTSTANYDGEVIASRSISYADANGNIITKPFPIINGIGDVFNIPLVNDAIYDIVMTLVPVTVLATSNYQFEYFVMSDYNALQFYTKLVNQDILTLSPNNLLNSSTKIIDTVTQIDQLIKTATIFASQKNLKGCQSALDLMTALATEYNNNPIV